VIDPEVPRLARGMWKRFLAAATLIVLLTGGATATAGLLEVGDFASELNRQPQRLNVADVITPAEAGAPQTLLLLGSDSRVADRRRGIRGNSDTMILVRLDPNKDATAVMSIPRDLKVQIPLPSGGVTSDKINQAYAIGGPRLTLRTIKRVLGIDINHVVNVNFRGFREAVNSVGCVYADVDRRYFNDNALAYATINVQPGYQKMCGEKALDYVRFRHDDNDLVRAARQQDFLRQAKDQVGVRRIIEDRHGFARLFARYSETDIRGSTEILRLFKLVAFSAGHPIREVHFRTRIGPSFVISTKAQVDATVDEFLNAQDSPGPRGSLASTSAEREAARRRPDLPRAPLGLENAQRFGEDQAIEASAQLRLPVLYPRVRTRSSVYVDVPRTYVVQDNEGRRHEAYRMVIKKGTVGEYYGIQGTSWMYPPILSNPSETRRMGARTYQLFYDGDRLRLVALRTSRGVYWVSNSLLLSVSNRQMLAIARSLQPVGPS
jgi:LCP family protein required for cell wall assembly